MAVINIGQKAEKIETYKGAVQIDAGADQYQFKLVTDMEVIYDDTNVQTDRIDDGSSVFTRIGDTVGSFRFSLKNTVDLYDNNHPPTNERTVSYWQQKISQADFPTVDFIEVFNAPNSAGNKFARLKFKGRMKEVRVTRRDGVAIPDVEVLGDITQFTSAQRSVS